MVITYSVRKCDKETLIKIRGFAEDEIAQRAGVFDIRGYIDKKIIEKSIELIVESNCLEEALKIISYQSPSLGLVISNILVTNEFFDQDSISTVAILEKGIRNMDDLSTRIAKGNIKGQKFPAIGAFYAERIFVLAREGKKLVFAEVDKNDVRIINERLLGLRGATFLIQLNSPYLKTLEIPFNEVIKRLYEYMSVVLESAKRRILDEISLAKGEETPLQSNVIDLKKVIEEVIKIEPYFLAHGSRLELFIRDALTLSSLISFLKIINIVSH